MDVLHDYFAFFELQITLKFKSHLNFQLRLIPA